MGFLDAPATARASWPVFQPYSPDTRPVWLDAAWEFFLGKPHDASASINTTTLNGSVAVGATSATVTSSAGLAVGELFFIGSGDLAETCVIEAISTNTLTLYPRTRFAHGSGETCGQVWTNETHPTAAGYAALAGWMVNARMPARGRVLASYSFQSTYTDANGVTTMPVGLESLVHTSGTFSVAAWSSATRHPHARRGNGTSVIGAGSGTGFRTLASIDVTPGDLISVEVHIKSTGNFPLLAVHDKDTGTLIASASVGSTSVAFGWQNLGRKSVLPFVVPAGTTDIEVRITQPSASNVTWYTDDLRVIKSITPGVAAPYAIPDPGTRNIAVLGDSWVVGGFAAFQSALEARCGRSLRVINAGVTGETFDEQLDRWDDDVAPYDPCAVVHLSCFMNDLAGARTQAQMDADTLEFVTRCRSIGAVPIMLGPAPYASSLTGSLDNVDALRALLETIGA